MSTQRNGGPAFPADSFGSQHNPGMSLRDWFAGQALAGLGDWTPDGPEVFDEHGGRMYHGTPAGDAAAVMVKARWAFQQADAMLAAREVRS